MRGTLMLAIALGSSLSPQTHSGDLDPSAAPAPSHALVEPRTAIGPATTPGDAGAVHVISQPGSYYLTQNLAGVAGMCGIRIGAQQVTLDLNGFQIVGVPGSLDGLLITGAGAVVTNGTISDWGGSGVSGIGGPGSRFERLRVARNGGDGLDGGTLVVIQDCVAELNGDDGIGAASLSTISNCLVRDSGSDGIRVARSCVIRDCVAYRSGERGLLGNAGGNVVSNCTSESSSLEGFRFLTAGDALIGCTASRSGGDGIYVQNNTTVSGCTLNENGGDGIEAGANCRIESNTCLANGTVAAPGAAIHATGTGNRIEANTCDNSDRGIDVDAAGNFIIRNCVSGVANDYIMTGAQTIGEIITTTGTIPDDVSPWANFSN